MEEKEQSVGVTVESLLKRAFLFLEDGDRQSANNYCERVLDIDPENAGAYLCKLLAELGVDKIENLKNFNYPFESSKNYQKILRYGTPELKAELEKINNRNEQQRFSDIYNNAYNLMQSATSEAEFKQAADIFKTIFAFEDSKAKFNECMENAEFMRNEATYNTAVEAKNEDTAESLELAVEKFKEIPGWKDSDELALFCQNRLEEIKAEEKRNRIGEEKNKKETIIVFLVVGIVIFAIVFLAVIIPKFKLAYADRLYKDGRYDEAIEVYSEIGSSGNRISEAKHAKAVDLYKAGKYDEAIAVLLENQDYNDSGKLLSLMFALKSPGATISTGSGYTVGLKADGTVVATGDNEYGQCNVQEWTDIVAVSAGSSHTVGLKADGTVVATGNNSYGQCDVYNWTDVVAISAYDYHTVGLKSDGTVVATGDNSYGQCDVYNWTDIVAISAVNNNTIVLKSNGKVVEAGSDYYVCYDKFKEKDIIYISNDIGLRKNGTVVAEGYNDCGECDVQSWTDIVAISAEDYHTVGLKSDGTVVAVGKNYEGQCNVSDWTNIKTPETK